MNVDEALRQFAEEEKFPRAAMTWALENWEAASPRFVSRLRAFAAGGDRSISAKDEAFCIVHLCGQKGETRAYEPTCRLIADDPNIEEWLGDGVTETLPGILIKVFDGDVEPLQRALEAPRGNEFARSAALAALGYLVRAQGVLSDEDMRLYLRRLRLDAAPREESEFWVTWAMTAADLGYGDLRIDVAMLMKDGLIDECDFDLDAFDRRVELVRDDPAGLAGFHGAGVLPLDDAVEVLDAWSSFSEDDFDRGENVFDSDMDSEFEDIAAPYVNPLRQIGRNDPCPCGSGKKYKKCCLGA